MVMHLQKSNDYSITYNKSARTPTTQRGQKKLYFVAAIMNK